MRARCETTEHPFDHAQGRMGVTRFLMNEDATALL
jgi:hypothetical protein